MFSTIYSKNKSLQGWYWYDWANQAYAVSVLTVLLPMMVPQLFNTVTGGERIVFGLKITGTSFYAYLVALGNILVAIISPVVGAIADKYPIKKRLLWWYTLFGVLSTALLGLIPYVETGTLIVLSILYIMSNIGFAGGNIIYYAFMPFLSKEKSADEISSIGTAYGMAGGSLILIVHLLLMIQSKGSAWSLSFGIISSAIWWFLWGLFLFKNTIEPEIIIQNKPKPLHKIFMIAFYQLYSTLKNIKKYKQIIIFLFAYLLFYDGTNTIATMANAYGTQVLRLPGTMSAGLILIVHIISIPSTIILGMLATKIGPKKTLMIALSTYFFIGITAIGLVPLPLEFSSQDLNRYDFQFRWNQEKEHYTINTLYNKPICCEQNSWISGTGKADAELRSLISDLLLVKKPSKNKKNISKSSINHIESEKLINRLKNFKDHAFSFGFSGGKYDGIYFVGNLHPTIIGDSILYSWTSIIRNSIWIPLNMHIEQQWILLGILVGIVMGTVMAQTRSIISLIIPKSQSAEFFGFFGFIMKSAAMIGPLIYAFCTSLFDDRMGMFSIVIVIFLGIVVFYFFNLEEGILAAKKTDQENLI